MLEFGSIEKEILILGLFSKEKTNLGEGNDAIFGLGLSSLTFLISIILAYWENVLPFLSQNRN